MARMIFDTETTGLNKPFCYDVGYRVIDDNCALIVEKHFIIEQIWHNLPLFESAYYKEKRPLYVKLMRQHKAIMSKFGWVMQEITRDIKKYHVVAAYAYNSEFDDKVIDFNCDWFKVNNPFESTPIFDIWAYASQFITNTTEYQMFCETNKYFTDTGNYKASAEIVYRYLTQDLTFDEAHMGLYDTQIETQILMHCINAGAEWEHEYKLNKVLKRSTAKPFVVKVNGETICQSHYVKKYIQDDRYYFTTEG